MLNGLIQTQKVNFKQYTVDVSDCLYDLRRTQASHMHTSFVLLHSGRIETPLRKLFWNYCSVSVPVNDENKQCCRWQDCCCVQAEYLGVALAVVELGPDCYGSVIDMLFDL